MHEAKPAPAGSPAASVAELPPELIGHYTKVRVLPDGRICGVMRLLFHWTMHIGIDWTGYSDRYCFPTEAAAVAALEGWDGTGEPLGWHRHPNSGRRRDLQTGEAWVEW